jgi:transcriptional regulator with XRE-family HTH domain
MITTFDLRQLRLSKGLPQDIIGNRKSIGKIEKGLTMPGPKLTRRMANALGVSAEAVFAACAESRRRAGSAATETTPATQGAAS